MRVLRAPSVEELLRTKHVHYPFPKTFEAARNEALVLVHTSGTTALPKPVVYTHDWAASYIRATQIEPPCGFQSQDKEWQCNRVLIMLPAFHVSLSRNQIRCTSENDSSKYSHLAETWLY